MYIAPGQGQTAPRGQNFAANRKALSLYPFVASFKEIKMIQKFSFHVYISFHVYRQNFDANRKALSLYPFVASFKELSLKYDFIQEFS